MTFFNRLTRSPLLDWPAWILPGLIFVALSGCGEPNPLSGVKLYPVKGKVVLPDGKPLSAGKIVFVGDKTAVTSATDIGSDGGFEFKEGKGAGLPEGDYRIRIETTSGKGKNKLPFPARYLDEDGSHLKATVTSDDSKNTFEFKLDAKDLASSTTSPKGGHKPTHGMVVRRESSTYAN